MRLDREYAYALSGLLLCFVRLHGKKCYGMACVCSGKSRIKKTKKPGNAAANRLSGLCRGG